MTKQSVYCATFFSLMIFCGATLAQNPFDSERQNEIDPCAHYRTPVVAPDGGTDYKLRVIDPPANIEYKARVINPCAQPGSKVAVAQPNQPGNDGKQNSTLPLYRLLPPTTDRIKTPSERLKEYVLPTQPKKDQ